MRPQRVKPGDSLTIAVYDAGERGGRHISTYKELIVEKVYPHHVLAYDGRFYECFTFGQLVQMGLEDGHNKPFTYGSTGQAWHEYHKDQIEEENNDSDYH